MRIVMDSSIKYIPVISPLFIIQSHCVPDENFRLSIQTLNSLNGMVLVAKKKSRNLKEPREFRNIIPVFSPSALSI